jgi:ABC-type branched-subunit amino acid transport system substrate-binding protein
MKTVGRALLAMTTTALLSLAAHAQTLVIGQTSGVTGPVAAGVKENIDGAKLYFDAINAAGGINGRRLELVTLDDKFDPKLAAENARKLIVERNAIALFMNRGTPHTEAIRPLLDQYEVPLVAPSTGAMVLHKPAHPWIFNVRATYQREADKAVNHLASVGLQRIGIFQVADSFGDDGATGALRGFDAVKLKPVFHEKFDRSKPDLSGLVKLVQGADAQAVVFLGAAAVVAEGTKLLRQAGLKTQIVTLSNNASSGFIKQLGEYGAGTIVTQVFPNERAVSIAMIRQITDLAQKAKLGEVTPAMLEGFAGAKVLVEGLRRAGNNPTRASLQAALNGFKRVDIGGLEVSFSPGDHSGLDFADLSIVSGDGRFRR